MPDRPLGADSSPPEPGILLVEDNPLDARATFNAAQKLDMSRNIEVVPDGQAALDLLRVGGTAGPSPKLVLLDLNLPGKNGHEILAEIRSDPNLQATPVVVLTSSCDRDDIHRAYSRGANAYVTKPAGLDGWLHVLATINEFWLTVAQLPAR